MIKLSDLAPEQVVEARALYDAGASHVAIGKDIGLTGPSVYSRIGRLEKSGVILGYAAQLNGEKVDQGLVAFVRLSVKTAALTQ